MRNIKTKQVHIKKKKYVKPKMLDIRSKKESMSHESDEAQSPVNNAQETIYDNYNDNVKVLMKNTYRLAKNKYKLLAKSKKHKKGTLNFTNSKFDGMISHKGDIGIHKQLAENNSFLRKYQVNKNEKGISKIFKIIKHLIKGTVKLIKVTSNVLLILGAFMLPVIVVTSGIFIIGAVLTPSSPFINEYLPISAEVESYREVVHKHAEEQGIGEYTDLLLAIMMQESGGQGDDPMQSSECEFNKEYPQVPNGIEDPDYSIKTGILYFKECLNLSLTDYPDDMTQIYLALQGYNYGKGYISWAVQNFGGYSYFNAIAFSEQKKAEFQTSVYGDPEYVPHVLRYYR